MLRSSLFSKITTATAVLGGASAVGYYFYRNPESGIHQYVIMPTVRLFTDGETAHRMTIETYKFPALCPREGSDWTHVNDPKGQLSVELFKKSANPRVKPIVLDNCVGVAPGFDKNGEIIDACFGLGFSMVEIGSVTPLPQPGNPQPRVFRLLKDEGVINRYGFNSDGHAAVLERLKLRLAAANAYPKPDGIPNSLQPGHALSVNLGKNKTGAEIGDFVKGVNLFTPYADILVVNVSSPNTPGLRDLQADEKLTALLKSVVAARDAHKQETLPPIVVKIAPDLSETEIASIARSVKASKVEGVIVSNTTIARPDTLKSPEYITREAGGLSGKPVKPLSIKALTTLKKHIGDDVTLIGCGGISSGKDAVDFAKAGADFVEMYSGLAYVGPGLACQVKRGILEELGDKKWSDLKSS